MLVANTCVQTFSGLMLNPLSPDPASIVIEDIAHQLSLINRFAGATTLGYSVAQHSVLVSWCCEPEDALHGLLHDASEAYLGELVRPVKQLELLGGYRAVEGQLLVAIYGKFGLGPSTPASVKLMDDRLAVTEARALFPSACVPMWALERESLPLPIEPWSPSCAEREFLARFRQLSMIQRLSMNLL